MKNAQFRVVDDDGDDDDDAAYGGNGDQEHRDLWDEAEAQDAGRG